jgi:hypothetical protein
MALERFIAEHLRITATLVGIPCERMTAIEIFLEDNRYSTAVARRVVEHAEAVTGTYTGLLALLEAIGDKLGVDVHDRIDAAEAVEYVLDDGEIFERANELLAV